MQTVFTLVIYFNFSLITLFFIRLLIQSKSITISTFYAREILVFYLLTYGYYTFKIIFNGSENYYNFLNVFIPLLFTFTLMFPNNKINIINLALYSLSGTIIYCLDNNYLVISLYIIGISSIIHKSLFLAKQRGKIRTLAIVYINLSIAQLLSFTNFMMHEIEFNWKDSIYLKYYIFLPLIIYPTLTIFTHVKFRRFFYS